MPKPSHHYAIDTSKKGKSHPTPALLLSATAETSVLVILDLHLSPILGNLNSVALRKLAPVIDRLLLSPRRLRHDHPLLQLCLLLDQNLEIFQERRRVSALPQNTQPQTLTEPLWQDHFLSDLHFLDTTKRHKAPEDEVEHSPWVHWAGVRERLTLCDAPLRQQRYLQAGKLQVLKERHFVLVVCVLLQDGDEEFQTLAQALGRPRTAFIEHNLDLNGSQVAQ